MLPNCFRAEGKFVKEFFGGCWMLRGVDEISSYNYPLQGWNPIFWWGRGGFAFGMTIRLVWVLCMFCTRECFGWYQIRSPLSVTVMIGGVVVCVGLYLLGGLCISRRRPSLGIWIIFFPTRFYPRRKTCAFGNLQPQGPSQWSLFVGLWRRVPNKERLVL